MQELNSLVMAAKQGDKDAFGQIVNRFQDMAFASAYAMLGDVYAAQDAAQEAFIDAYLSLSNLREPAAFPGWFRRIIWKHGDRQLRGKPVTILPLEFAEELHSPLPTPEDALAEALRREDIHKALQLLPPEQSQVITLFYVEGYAQQEIAAFLELPVTTIKKRLFDARKKLKERMIPIMQQTLQTTKPSQNDDFANKVQFFLALRDRDLSQVQKLVKQQPTLLQARTEWQMALGHDYWPLGSTALHLAAGAGSDAILAYLLTQPVDINEPDRSGLTPLHIAAVMGQTEAAHLLLQKGADVNARSTVGQTPLHQAVLRNNQIMAELLLTHKADLNLTDSEGRTAVDWAAIHQDKALVDFLVAHGAPSPRHWPTTPKRPPLSGTPQTQFGDQRQAWLGRIINGQGQPLDGQPLPVMLAQSQLDHALASPQSPILNTGIKIIDLLAPLPRGGQIGIFTPLSGVGLVVVLGQLIDSLSALHNGPTVWLLMESDKLRAQDQKLVWRELGVDHQIVFVAGNRQDSVTQQRQTVATGWQIAEQLGQTGQDVLLLVDSQFAFVEGIVPYLKGQAMMRSGAAITTLYHGHATVGVEPKPLQGLDATLTFDYTRAKQRLYPAIDPVRSTSRLLQSDLLDPTHRAVAAEVKRLLQRYSDLRLPMDTYNMDVDALWYIEDDPNLVQDIRRARRLDRFLTQPFYGAEPWTGMLGQRVDVKDTIAGCQAILAGRYDALPEEVFRFVGALEQAVEKAKHL
ncbi:MAG: sigma-70 family RNA polymerase sigma factor [Caldilineaceae bacterium]